MKNMLLLCFVAALTMATGCKNDKDKTIIEQQEQSTPSLSKTDTVPPVQPGSAATDITDAETSTANWYGSYNGSLPCGDCKGILTTLTVNPDKTYTLSSQYLGKENKPNLYKGTYNLDNKKIITLDAEGDHLKFQVKEQAQMLVKLDKFGDPEQGAPQARFYLHKTR